jgi:hypothetical protein
MRETRWAVWHIVFLSSAAFAFPQLRKFPRPLQFGFELGASKVIDLLIVRSWRLVILDSYTEREVKRW